MNEISGGVFRTRGLYASDFPGWEEVARIPMTEEAADAVIESVETLRPGTSLGKTLKANGTAELYVQRQLD